MCTMQMPALATWAWIPIVVAAAAFQTIRNAAQRSLVAELGTLSATLVRFLYGLPFAALWLVAVLQFLPAGGVALSFTANYFLWLTVGAVAATRMACAPELMALEARVLALLRQSLGLSFDGRGRMVLSGAGGSAMVLERAI